MATYYRGRPLADTKYIVHPHYATAAEAQNEAIGHQVRQKKTIFFLQALSKNHNHVWHTDELINNLKWV